MLQKIQFKIKGLHCASCKTLIEEDLKVLPGISKAAVDYAKGEAEVEFDQDKITREQIFQAIRKLNYQPLEADGLSDAKAKKQPSFLLGLFLPLALIILVAIYYIWQRSGGFEILSRLNEGNIGYGLIFIIGLLAGFHCIGMCGSIVVSYSTLCVEPGKKSLWPHWQYNIGRIISYTIIGGILGGFGSFFGVNPVFNGALTILAGIFMLVLGVSLVSKSPLLEKFKLKTPAFIARYIFSQKNKKNAPLLIGLLNGFMPCGPLQAMQLYALASGSLIKGAFSLLVYAVGTSFMLFGFGAFLSFIKQKHIANILKMSGVLVILLSLLMINRGLANFGYNWKWNLGQNINTNQVVANNGQFQEIRMDVTYSGYEPNVLYAKKSVPVRWVINAKQLSGCTSRILLPDYGISKDLVKGENIIEFTPDKSGELKFSCGMKMIWGKFIIN